MVRVHLFIYFFVADRSQSNNVGRQTIYTNTKYKPNTIDAGTRSM